MSSPKWTDEKVEIIIGNLLGAGVLISALVVFCGGVIFLTYHGNSYANYSNCMEAELFSSDSSC